MTGPAWSEASSAIGEVVTLLELAPLDAALDEVPDPPTNPQDADRLEVLRAAVAFRNTGRSIVARFDADDRGEERDR